ncbi:hypothetical protein E2C01_098208 [Portunus trituberculatus]|uniref:Uncharacterized protein n=1 Tax=Portunus trituberculatus TaxID=210409 RepID=A0A5B7K7N5_PORTR|nr:hypothetical protein [Portunus trituberculatus]
MARRNQNEREWIVTRGGRVGTEWDMRKWKSEIDRARAQCMDVNVRNYRWSEFRSKVCQMCDMGEDEIVEHVMLECEKYERQA